MRHVAAFSRAKAQLDDGVRKVTEWDEFVTQLDNKKLLLAPFCGEIMCEGIIKTALVSKKFYPTPTISLAA